MTDTVTDNLARDVEILAGLFKAGGWSEVRVESEGLSLLLSEDVATPSLGDNEALPIAHVEAPRARPTSGKVAAPTPIATSAEDIDPAWAVVTAPNLGTFYRSPKPGAAPFIEVGQEVEAATEVCLIEVMKLFTSVRAEVSGIVRRIAVADAELVEGGRALIYIERK